MTDSKGRTGLSPDLRQQNHENHESQEWQVSAVAAAGYECAAEFRSALPKMHAALDQLLSDFLEPASRFLLVEEDVAVTSQTFEDSTVLTRDVSAGRADALVPLLRHPKSSLMDNVRIDTDEGTVRVLPSRLNSGATAAFALVLLDLMMDVTHDERQEGPSLSQRTIAVLTDAKDRTVEARALVRAFEQIGSGAGLEAETAKDVLVELIGIGAKDYIVFGALDTERTDFVRLKIERTYDRRQSANENFFGRTALGLQPREHRIECRRMRDTGDYHLTVRTPVGMYAYERKVTGSDVSVAPPLFNISRKLMHTRVTGVRSVTKPDPSVVLALEIKLRERPPALLELSLFFSSLLSVIVLVVGLNHDNFFTDSPGSSPTVLFGIPLVLAGWLFSRADKDATSRLSLLSMTLLGWLMVNLATAAVLAAMKGAQIRVTDDGSKALSVFGVDVTHPLWAALMMSSALQLGLAAVVCLCRALRYAQSPHGGDAI